MAADGNPAPDPARPLWAPWRIEYIRGPKGGGCFFCDKASRDTDLADHIVARGEHAFVLLNDYPYNSGHLMVAPYRHIGDLAGLLPEERAEIMELIVLSENLLKRVMNPQGFNIGFNLGLPAGAGVADHVHGHVVPRWNGDTNFMAVVGDTRVVPESLDQTTELLREAWNEGRNTR
jgi:ATP adenylyltransferase